MTNNLYQNLSELASAAFFMRKAYKNSGKYTFFKQKCVAKMRFLGKKYFELRKSITFAPR